MTVRPKSYAKGIMDELARPMVTESALEASYRDMILDDERERAATEWIEGLVGDSLPGGPMLRGEVWWVNFDPSVGGEKRKRSVPR